MLVELSDSALARVDKLKVVRLRPKFSGGEPTQTPLVGVLKGEGAVV